MMPCSVIDRASLFLQHHYEVYAAVNIGVCVWLELVLSGYLFSVPHSSFHLLTAQSSYEDILPPSTPVRPACRVTFGIKKIVATGTVRFGVMLVPHSLRSFLS